MPDLPLDPFDTEWLNTADIAYQFGAPDAALATASFAANLPIAAWGNEDRSARHAWVPVVAAVKAGVDAAVSGWYFYQMPTREKAWCPYCVVSGLSCLGILALSLPEAVRACQELPHRRGAEEHSGTPAPQVAPAGTPEEAVTSVPSPSQALGS